MINELKDDEILNFLMTSEFDGDFKPDELKYLLNKWRYFYRILYGVSEREKVESDGKIKELNDKIKILESEVKFLMMTNAKNEDKINLMRNRKLTWKERFWGKIITKDDENK
jgi:hypothetical protein